MSFMERKEFLMTTSHRTPRFLLALILAVTLPAMAQDRSPQREQERIYGSQLMTEQERSDYRQQMRSKRTEQEREALRQEHHQRMVERARERGIQLPEQPPQGAGRGMGPGGGGMGPGGGR
jgi:hypothetical protein